MGNKPHQHPHDKAAHASWPMRIFVTILVVAVFGLALYLSATGHILVGRR